MEVITLDTSRIKKTTPTHHQIFLIGNARDMIQISVLPVRVCASDRECVCVSINVYLCVWLVIEISAVFFFDTPNTVEIRNNFFFIARHTQHYTSSQGDLIDWILYELLQLQTRTHTKARAHTHIHIFKCIIT